MMRWTMALFGVVALAACDKPAETKGTSPSTLAAPPTTPAAPPSAQPTRQVAMIVDGVAQLHVSSRATVMAFDQTELSVPAGSTVHLAFENVAPGALPHNWVLVKAGTEAKVAGDGVKKGEAGGYVPDDADVLAHTDLVKPGATADITFKAPPVGAYPYVCTYPGHFAMMKGVLTVTP